MRARPGLSVHREDAQRDAEAREEAVAEAVNAALAWLIDHHQFELAQQMRAFFVEEEPAQAVAAE